MITAIPKIFGIPHNFPGFLEKSWNSQKIFGHAFGTLGQISTQIVLLKLCIWELTPPIQLMISLIFYGQPTPLKSFTMATGNALFPIFEFQNFTDTYLGKVTKFQFNCFSRLGAAFKKPEGGGIRPPVRLGLMYTVAGPDPNP